ncbi:MAG: TolC family protein [Acidobacteria bacterium]|nr:MAG: TolC family protein [Acidobacteriota bacterium]
MKPFARPPRPAAAAIAFVALLIADPLPAWAQPVQPLTLLEAVSLALSNSPDVRPATDQVSLSRIQQQLAESTFGLKVAPSFGSGNNPYGFNQQSVGLAVSKRLPLGTQISLMADSSRWNASDGGPWASRDGGYAFNVVQPLLRGSGPSATIDLVNARRGVQRSDRQLRESRQQIVVNVAEQYFSAARLMRLAATSDLALVRARRLHAASEARASVGLATQLDVLRAELLAARAQADLELQREALSSAMDLLKLSLGRSPDSLLEILEPDVAGDPFGVGRYASQPVDDLVMLAVATRPDVAEARARIDDARRNQTVARWNLLPELNVNMSYARRGLGSSQPGLLNDLLGGWRFGVSSSYSLDRSAQTASAATAGVEMLAAEHNVVETERRLAADVRRAHRAWTRAAESIAIQQKAVDLADQQLRLAQLRYERGIASNFDVIDAEHHVSQAHASLVAAEVDRQLAGLTLLRTLGTLSPEEIAR